jgi:mycofactocin system glycosyltransferase
VGNGRWRVVSERPLGVLVINSAAARMLKATQDGASIGRLTALFGLAPERALSLCEYFRRRGILEVSRDLDPSAAVPSVSVVVPTRDRAEDLDECLGALAALDYIPDKLEVIVVDDGSSRAREVAEVVRGHGFRLLVNDRNRGPSFSRNRGAWHARGEILAFIDSDCVASSTWLRDLTPYFGWDRVGAVGGRTTGYYTEGLLDRYEEVASPLDMGRHLRVASRGSDTFYVPTCNLLVRRSVYSDLGGLREGMSLGEDVDLCWRLRDQGHYLVYAPEGVVRHKHRNQLVSMLRRRAGYGSSEASLYSLHPDKRKTLPWEPAPMATAGLVSAAAAFRQPLLAGAAVIPALWDALRREERLRASGVDLPRQRVWLSVARGHSSMLYFACFHLVRYYLGPLAAVAMVSRGVSRLAAFAAIYAGTVDYVTKRPRLGYLSYLGCYLAEHLAYQAGVIAGCVRAGTFRSYRVEMGSRRSQAQSV